jgi:hypothetical protein
MTNITNLIDFKKYCLRALGAPVVNVDVTDEQMDDRFNEAMRKFNDFHHNGTERTYLKVQVSSTDVTNKFITIPTWVTGVVKVLSFTDATASTASPFSVQYQLRLNDIWDMGSTSVVYYEQLMQYTHMLDLMFNGTPIFRFNRVQDKVYIDTSWGTKLKVGDWVVIECYRALDPVDYIKIYDEPWLKSYVTALFKRQWGINIKKFQGIQTIGGAVIDGQALYMEAIEEIKELEQELVERYQEPPTAIFIG